ncbi:MAG: hypothetical protein GWN18_15090, partial [Thermoplasmata archaeon]|nr:hypothetical protein [Thermoplasmata archaeon]NIS10881.1 hypothetical protein [Thermoplasmata archaeon]NIS18814.1 hypothetical protein [Thermoplasmata archaeon]NIT75840.1 hypothetical protein [Thermoplasmata archaeon]NIU47975.1 hypothetical protein [Thermoplasmata archaeon]
TIRVFEDTKWSEWDTVLEWPVFIEPGVTLTVEDSYLEIPLERMVFEEWPVFNLEFDSDLVFTNSTLRV